MMMADVAVPTSKLPEAMRKVKDAVRLCGVPTITGGHLGDSNIHPTLWFDKSNEEQKKAIKLLEYFGKIAIKYDGTISAEHGIGVRKREMLKTALEGERIHFIA